ncbi:MAG: substrate-binding domain-containing protein [Ignavibacteriae bacterium]|nr:substrate-binding domain-containing protein [Ignavibacteriota bacterium]
MMSFLGLRGAVCSVVIAGAALIASCGGEKKNTSEGRPVVVIGLVAKSQANAVFQAAHRGALDAARELGPRYGVEVDVRWMTPPEENAQKQADAIEQLARSGAQGIAVSCSDANTVTPAIDKAVGLGAHVMCFDSDAPRSKRFCYFGTDDLRCGEAVMRRLAVELGEKGMIAILAGNQSAPNLQARVEGVRGELVKHPGITLARNGIYYHAETPEQAAEMVNRAQSLNPEISGWAMVGGWPLFTKGALKWPAGSVKVVAVDALPPQLEYLDSGHVQALLAQDCYGWGRRAVEILLERIVRNTTPASVRIVDTLTVVTKANARDFREKWKSWLKD